MCVCAELLQSCPTLSDPVDCSPPGSSVHGILQARTLEWVLCSPPGDLPDLVIKPKTLMFPTLAGRLFITSATWEAPATAAKSLQSCPTLCDPIDGSHQAPPSLGFSRQEHWSGLPFPSPMHESEK